MQVRTIKHAKALSNEKNTSIHNKGDNGSKKTIFFRRANTVT